ncbi:hypothetical protein K458DRAFT_436246 [Lentithecium fluviatile CBS 122367]|uniref:Uncharacterized protein n=1 Tax=Lentithecium fluviatile CBS 122367 TaxID=1168545 RepID=A0A6G1IIM6_9PLEO|nr:hypothetical protein K458DRAFT_436246 [Lentithecium fluviatile CBS 122367]
MGGVAVGVHRIKEQSTVDTESIIKQHLNSNNIFSSGSISQIKPYQLLLTITSPRSLQAKMKTTTSAILSASMLLATAAAAPSSSATYTLKIDSQNPQLKDSTLVLKDDTTANTFPNALGSFSTGEPRYPYTFTVSTVSEADKLYELKYTKQQSHLIVNGHPWAPQLFNVPIGADPIPDSNATVTRNKFLIMEEGAKMLVLSAEDVRGYDGDFMGPGTWRACTSGTIDYQLYFFDGLHDLNLVVEGCETVSLLLEEVKADATTTVVPAPTATGSGFITGVPAPTATGTGTGNTTGTGATPSPSSFPGAASRLGMTGTLMGLAAGAMALLI